MVGVTSAVGLPTRICPQSGTLGDMTMHTLVLLRHAKAERPDRYPQDVDRPLSSRGRADAAAAGRWLADAGLVPDRVLCSPSVRTRDLCRVRVAPLSERRQGRARARPGHRRDRVEAARDRAQLAGISPREYRDCQPITPGSRSAQQTGPSPASAPRSNTGSPTSATGKTTTLVTMAHPQETCSTYAALPSYTTFTSLDSQTLMRWPPDRRSMPAGRPSQRPAGMGEWFVWPPTLVLLHPQSQVEG
jgi:hypothetical protein